MHNQIYYEDVAVGNEITSLTKHPTTRQLVKWAGASTDYAEIHYDKDWAISKRLPSQIVHGQLATSFVCQMITDWIGSDGDLKKIFCAYRGMNLPGETILCKGQVTRKYIENGVKYIECQAWAENPRKEKTVQANATVTLPSKTR